MILSPSGRIVQKELERTEQLRKRVTLGKYIIMPDHLHAILALEPVRAQAMRPYWMGKNKFGPQRNNLSSIIRGFKGTCTKQIRENINPTFAWHRSFYDRVIRNN